MSTWTRGVIAFDLAIKLTDEDGDTAMDEEESLAQHGFADYTLAPMATEVSIFHGDRVQLTCIQCLFRAAGDGKL